MGVTAVIPARFASSRFPGKVLARQTGKYLIEHVWERVCAARLVDEVLIATDSEQVGRACAEFGARWRMTRADHASGTDRVAEAVADVDADLVVNVQGDEPELDAANIDALVRMMGDDEEAQMGTLKARIEAADELVNPNVVKVVTDQHGHALYFSRCTIPYERDGADSVVRYKHLGIYAYRKEVLLALSRLAPTPLELAEKLEQLRALEHGYTIALAEVAHAAVGIDTPEQYAAFVARYQAGQGAS